MKIQCDVCNKDEASVFCVADEASLCSGCDHRVHHANKLAGKHQRFSLHHPLPDQSPLCDICQERRAFLFCQQDRAILCRECDIPIHKANSHTLKHARFLLTGVTLSANCTLYSDSFPSSSESAVSSSSNLTNYNDVSKVNSQESKNNNNNKHTIGPLAACTPPTAEGTTAQSSISEYLIEMLPGWHVEDFLDAPSPYAFSKNGEKNDLLPLWDDDLQSNMMNAFSTSKMGSWVPQAPPPHLYNQTTQIQSYSCQSVDLAFGLPNGLAQEFTTNNIKFSRQRSEDNSFAVPQITANKKSRNLW